MKRIIVTAWLLAIAAGAAVAQATPAGLWKTIDDETKTEKALIRITENGGVFTGTVDKILTDRPDAKCVACTDERKDKPVLGMIILRDLKPDGDDRGTWVGGDILDPNNGKVYQVRIRTADGGNKLEVRGYIGTPLLSRTQIWLRVE